MPRNNALDKLLGEHRKAPVDLEKKSRYSVKADRWDMAAFERILASQSELATARQKLATNIAGEMGLDEGADAFWLLAKVYPTLADDPDIRPSRLLNKRVNEELVNLTEYKSVRRWTEGDPIASALAFEKLEPYIEPLYDKLQKEKEKQDEYEEKLKQAMAAASEQKTADEMLQEYLDAQPEEGEGDEEGEGEGDPEGDALRAAAAQAQANAQGAADSAAQALADFQQSMDGRTGEIQGELAKGLNEADQHLEMLNNMSIAWGSEPGDLMRLPAERRIELARRLNTPKFANMSRLIGPMIRDAFAEQKRKVVHTREEIVDLETGDDLPRVVATEWARLSTSEETELLFFKDLAMQNLVQYQMKGFEKIARGGIIYCHDGSGSMQGDREVWAKAVGLALLHVARRQKRSFYGIQFGSRGSYDHKTKKCRGEIRVDDFSDTKQLDADKVIDFAEFFFNGGTDFVSPLNAALQILQAQYDEFGGVQADIVFATDGCAGLTDDWMRTFKEVQRKLDFKVWGIKIAGIGGEGRYRGLDETAGEPLNTLCDGKVATLSSILNSADIRSVFGGL